MERRGQRVVSVCGADDLGDQLPAGPGPGTGTFHQGTHKRAQLVAQVGEEITGVRERQHGPDVGVVCL
jgi:hypothetical protein